MPQTPIDPTNSPNPSDYKGVRLDALSIRILRDLGQGNLSKGIRTAAQLTVEQSKTPLAPHALDLAIELAHAEQTTVQEIILRALTTYEASLSEGGKVPEFYKGTYNLKTRNTIRDSKIVHMVLEGTSRPMVAAKFNISLPRVHQIISAYRQANKYNPDAFKAWRPKPTSKNQLLLEKGMEELKALNGDPTPETPKPATPAPATQQGTNLPFTDEDLDDLGWD